MRAEKQFLEVGQQATIYYIPKEINMSKLSKITEITYSHTVAIVKKLETAGYLRTKKEGRERTVTLTQKGQEYQQFLKKQEDG